MKQECEKIILMPFLFWLVPASIIAPKVFLTLCSLLAVWA